jgi:hypothetical protein
MVALTSSCINTSIIISSLLSIVAAFARTPYGRGEQAAMLAAAGCVGVFGVDGVLWRWPKIGA